MKKLLGSIAVFSLFAAIAYAVPPSHYTETLPAQAPVGAIPVSNGYDWTLSSSSGTGQGLTLPSFTLQQLQVLTPATTGQIVFCSNCVSASVCVSSGTGIYGFVVVSSNTFKTQCL